MLSRCPRQLLAFALVVVGGLFGGHTAADTLTLRAADNQPADYPTAEAIAYMGERLEEISGGNLRIKLYSGGQLGEEKDALEITILGGIDLARVNIAPVNSIAPDTAVLGLPFLFRSTTHMRVVLDGPIGDEILASLEPHGLIGLAFYDSGARSFYNSKRSIRSFEDLGGLKIRVQNSELAVAMVESLGANPTPMGFGQVYESLLLGTIDGSENNWPSYVSTGHFEAAPHYTLTRHTMMPEILVLSRYRWQQLTAEQQSQIRRAAKESVPFMRDQWDERVSMSITKAIEAGVEVVEIEDLSPFVAAMEPVYEQAIASERMRNWLERIRVAGEAQ
jgi:tripartite ATP-independent transporter DctP family solute receptor